MDNKKQTSSSTVAARKYEAPRVEQSASFETLALSCGKTDPSINSCNPGLPPPLTGSLSAS